MGHRNIIILGLLLSLVSHLFLFQIFTFVAKPIPQKNKPNMIFLGAILQRRDMTFQENPSFKRNQKSFSYQPKVSREEESRPFFVDGQNKNLSSITANSSSKGIAREATMKFITEIPQEQGGKPVKPEPAAEPYKPLRLELNDKN